MRQLSIYIYIYTHTQYIHKPKLILKPDFSFCMAIDKTCRLTPSPTAASPIKIKMNTEEEYKQPHYTAIVLHT